MISVQACSSEDSKSLNVEQTHDRSGQPGKDTVAVQDDPEVYHEAETRRDTSTVLILQGKSYISEHLKVIQGAILLTLHYRTM